MLNIEFPGNSIPKFIPKIIESRDSNTSTLVLIAALFRKSKTWKQLKCPFTDEWINKVCYIHAMEYYSTLKRNKMLTHATMWMILENII